MIDFELVFAFIVLLTFLGMLICIGARWHIAATQLDEVLDGMNEDSMTGNLRHKFNGSRGKVLMLTQVATICAFQNFYLRKGATTLEELESIPKSFKRKVKVLFWSEMTLLSLMILSTAVLKFAWTD